jgi:transposase
MTPKQKRIISLYKGGKSKLGISKKVGVSRTYVYKVLNQIIKEAWKKV